MIEVRRLSLGAYCTLGRLGDWKGNGRVYINGTGKSSPARLDEGIGTARGCNEIPFDRISGRSIRSMNHITRSLPLHRPCVRSCHVDIATESPIVSKWPLDELSRSRNYSYLLRGEKTDKSTRRILASHLSNLDNRNQRGCQDLIPSGKSSFPPWWPPIRGC